MYDVVKTAKKAGTSAAEAGGVVATLMLILGHFIPEVRELPVPVSAGIVSLVSGACRWVRDWFRHRND